MPGCKSDTGLQFILNKMLKKMLKFDQKYSSCGHFDLRSIVNVNNIYPSNKRWIFLECKNLLVFPMVYIRQGLVYMCYINIIVLALMKH